MKPPKDPRVVFRVDPETWRLWNDKRHRDDETWQSLGEEFFGRWYRGEVEGPAAPSDPYAKATPEDRAVLDFVWALLQSNRKSEALTYLRWLMERERSTGKRKGDAE